MDVARDLVALHATDPATTVLSVWARLSAFAVEDLDRCLYDDRSLLKVPAMRGTLWVLPHDVLGATRSAVGNRYAAQESGRLIRDVERAGLHADGSAWLARVSADVLDVLADGRSASAAELRTLVPLLEGGTPVGIGRSWARSLAVAPRVMSILAAQMLVVRGPNDGGWTVSRPRYVAAGSWLTAAVPGLDPRQATAELVSEWLRAFGPGTESDLRWWLGTTTAVVRTALADLEAEPVVLDGAIGYVLPSDLDPVAPVDPWAALLPALDPTTMGWAERDWYVGAYRRRLFDSAGNGGPTVWWDGRIVGTWRHHEGGAVQTVLFEDLDAAGTHAVEQEAGRLSAWLGDTKKLPDFSPEEFPDP